MIHRSTPYFCTISLSAFRTLAIKNHKYTFKTSICLN